MVAFVVVLHVPLHEAADVNTIKQMKINKTNLSKEIKTNQKSGRKRESSLEKLYKLSLILHELKRMGRLQHSPVKTKPGNRAVIIPRPGKRDLKQSPRYFLQYYKFLHKLLTI